MFYYICLFYLKSTDIKEHLISLYCNDDDQLFQPDIQEILGSIAFEVCPNPCFWIVTLTPVIIKFQVVQKIDIIMLFNILQCLAISLLNGNG